MSANIYGKIGNFDLAHSILMWDNIRGLFVSGRGLVYLKTGFYNVIKGCKSRADQSTFPCHLLLTGFEPQPSYPSFCSEVLLTNKSRNVGCNYLVSVAFILIVTSSVYSLA